VRLRPVAFILVFVLMVAPILGVVCDIECDQVPIATACHDADTAPEGPTIDGPRICRQHYSAGSPVLITNGYARESVGTLGATPLTSVTSPSVVVASARVGMHGPPRPSGHTFSSSIAILRM
jgi:hypothetical protein